MDHGKAEVCVSVGLCLQGLNIAYYDSHADVLMMAIPSRIPDHFHTYLLGFDAADEVPEAAVGIHHPGGAPTSISTVNGRCVFARSNAWGKARNLRPDPSQSCMQ